MNFKNPTKFKINKTRAAVAKLHLFEGFIKILKSF